jgi:hypothetical protein
LFTTANLVRLVARIVREVGWHLACFINIMSQQRQSPFRQRTEKLQERTFEWAARILDLCPRTGIRMIQAEPCGDS